MPTVAEVLNQAMVKIGLNSTSLAREASVDRLFVNRLVRGLRPPHAKQGRKTAQYDERYARLAVTLGLNVSAFIELVEAEQGVKRTSRQESPLDKFARDVWATCVLQLSPNVEGIACGLWASLFTGGKLQRPAAVSQERWHELCFTLARAVISTDGNVTLIERAQLAGTLYSQVASSEQ